MSHSIIDLQSHPDHRNQPIHRVGIKDYKHPFFFSDKTIHNQATIGVFEMLVSLPSSQKGTHMSRFIEILQEEPVHLNIKNTTELLKKISTRLDSPTAFFQVSFPLFLTKQAPVSKVESLMNYEVCLAGALEQDQVKTEITITVPVTSLCPCSKAISAYGAHNQRSHIIVQACVAPTLWIEELIVHIETQASYELFSILKRPDEKAVTEGAYDNPKFVEDLARDVSHTLSIMPGIYEYTVEAINFESIHNHSAYAMIYG